MVMENVHSIYAPEVTCSTASQSGSLITRQMFDDRGTHYQALGFEIEERVGERESTNVNLSCEHRPIVHPAVLRTLPHSAWRRISVCIFSLFYYLLV